MKSRHVWIHQKSYLERGQISFEGFFTSRQKIKYLACYLLSQLLLSYKKTSGISWLKLNGIVSYFEFPSVIMCAFSWLSLKLIDFLSSGFDFLEISSTSWEMLVFSSFFSLNEFVRKFGDPFSGVEFRVVSLRKLISELHSSKWKLFL